METHNQEAMIQISALDTRWNFFMLICCKNCIACLNKLKRPGLSHFVKLGKRGRIFYAFAEEILSVSPFRN